MSSEEQPSSSDEAAHAVKSRSKKRRVQTVRACERCRAKKTRCDGVPGGGPCSQCIAAEAECVFSDKPKRRRDKAYIEGLESRLERLQLLLTRLHPDEDFSKELDGDEHVPQPQAGPGTSTGTNQTVANELGVNRATAYYEPVPYITDNKGKRPENHLGAIFKPATSPDVDDDEPFTTRWPADVVDAMRQNHVANPIDHYYGQSSGARLFNTALLVRSELEGSDQDVMKRIAASTKHRPEFWKPHPWELHRFQPPQQTCFVFPKPDLFAHVVDTYFNTSHLICPILHRGSFEADIAAGKHLVDEAFGSVALLVCATGARLSDDPRVLLDHPERPGHLHSAGWAWYSQVQLVRNAALAAPTLYDLQAVALSTVFTTGASPARSSWILTSTGIRMAMDMGIHRQHKAVRNTLEGELWKRAFWVLVFLDVWNSSFLGRPTAIALDSFDVDFPTDVDDKYWTADDPEKAFVQPPGEYSGAAYFVCNLKLNLIHAHALRTIYSPDKDRLIARLGQDEWERRVVIELDSALNRWADSVPDYLRWDDVLLEPGVESNRNKVLQSSVLHLMYQYTRITIHRPFIASPHGDSPLSLPSLTICTSAARAVVHLMQAQRRLLPSIVLMVPIIPSFLAGMVLLLRVWLAKRAGMRVDTLADMKDVFAVTDFLNDAEIRWPLAGRLKDLLRALANAGDLPLPALPSTKRPRLDDVDRYEETSLPTLHMPQTSEQQLAAQYSAGNATNGTEESAKHVLERVVPTTSSEMSVFGPPLARRADGLYAFDPASTGMTTSAATYGLATSSSSQPARPQYQSNPPTQSGYTAAGSYPSIPLDPGATLPPASYAPSQPSSSYRPTQTGTYLPQDDYSSFLSTIGANTGSMPGQSTNADDSQFMSLLGPAMAQDAPQMASIWSSLPATFQTEDWDRYVSSMASFAGNGNGSGQQQTSAFGQSQDARQNGDRASQFGYSF
ncbi:unnamed protein product [Peniophora sp. CBMAI 1063]|nr:unnamed protein product [Peniophora sp. CBMAI 1063]